MRALAFLALTLATSSLKAWEDPFGSWQATGYAQALGMGRESQGQPMSGALNSQGDRGSGWNQDGLVLRRFETKLSGGLGWQDWSAAAGVFTDLDAVGFTDLYLQWQAWASANLRAGQVRLAFGEEQQSSGRDLMGIQRSLIYGFSNYGHLGPWGLACLDERGWGLRAEQGFKSGALSLKVQLVGAQAKGNSFGSGLCGSGHLEARYGSPSLAASVGASGFVGRHSLYLSTNSYVPLGAQDPATAAWQAGSPESGKVMVTAWGADLGLDVLFLHARAESLLQRLGLLDREGGSLSAWVDLPAWEARAPRIYGRLDQACSSFPDGVHRADSLYRVATLGLGTPLPWGLSAKAELLQLACDDFSGFGGGRIYQAQLQAEF